MSESRDNPPPTSAVGQRATRPGSSRRPRTSASRPRTSRPDTSASGISAEELPDQQFFPEDDGFDEEEEYEDEEPEEEGVFAFARPKTGAPGAMTMSESEYGTSAPNTGLTSAPPLTSRTDATGQTFGVDDKGKHPEFAGNIDAGGRLPELTYDPRNPPIFSGKNNLNNSAFAFSVSTRDSRGSSRHGQPGMFNRLIRRNVGTASTEMTGTTDSSLPANISQSRTSFDSHDTGADSTEAGRQPRRMKSSAPLIPSTAGSGWTSTTGETSRGFSRGSYGMTELTGDITIPDGKTTWGDGTGQFKDIHDEGDQIHMTPMDMEDEDSPYPEVRASVSNLDDPDMPCE